MGVFEYGELNGSIHFHGLIYIPEGEMIGELVKKREYSTKRGERRTRYGNTFFDEYFGMSDFQEVNPILLKRGGTSRYLVKYIMKSGEKALYSKGLPSEIVREHSDNDIVGTYLDYVTKYVLWDDVLDLTSNTSENLLYGTFDNNINESLVTFTGSKYQPGSSYSSLPSPSKSDIPATKLFTFSIYDSTGLSAQYWGYINDDNPNNINITSSPYLQ